MLGSFGISAAIDRWSAADIATAAAHVTLYTTQLRDIIHHGDQYQLTAAPAPSGNAEWAAMWYVAKDGLCGVLFAFRLAGAAATRTFPLPGLHLTQRYRVQHNQAIAAETTGAALTTGLSVTIDSRFASYVCLIEAHRALS